MIFSYVLFFTLSDLQEIKMDGEHIIEILNLLFGISFNCSLRLIMFDL